MEIGIGPLSYTVLTLLTGVPVFAGVGYLSALLIASFGGRGASGKAGLRREKGGAVSFPWRRSVIIIPAHNEEPVIAGTLQSLMAQDLPADRFSIVVVADNCTDQTAAIARAEGATVMERHNREERGKGYALAWAMERLLADTSLEAFVFVDADTVAAPDFLRLLLQQLWERRDAAGRCALQCRYGVLNPGDGWRAGLMDAAFALINHIRPLGADRLGLSIDLKGNGMAFTREVMTVAPWSGRSITEDIDYGLDLLENHGVRVGYVPEARVDAQMPTDGAPAGTQRDRWENGRRLLRRRALPLFQAGLRRGDIRLIEAGLRMALPPLAEQCVLSLCWTVFVVAGVLFGWLPGSPAMWWLLASLPVAGLLFYVLVGLRLSGANASVYLSLLRAPFYAAWKLLRKGPKSGDSEWVRTERALKGRSG